MEEFLRLIAQMEAKVAILVAHEEKKKAEADQVDTELAHARHLRHWAARCLEGMKDYYKALEAVNTGEKVPNPDHPF